MATTFAQIKARVDNIIIDTNSAVSGEVPGYVRKAQAEIEDDRALDVLFSFWLTNLEDGDNTLTKPADYNGLRLKPYIQHGDAAGTALDGTQTFLEMLGTENSIGTLDLNETGKPKYFTDTSSTLLQVYPVADTSAGQAYNNKYRVITPYWAHLSTLTDDADTNWFCDNAEEYLVWRAAALGLIFNSDPREGKYLALAQQERKRLRGAAIRARFPSGWSIKPNRSSELGSRHTTGRAFKPSDPSIHEGPI